MSGLVPLFLDVRVEHVHRALTTLFSELEQELTSIVKPLETLMPEELRVLESETTAAQVGSLWEANGHALRQLLPLDVGATKALGLSWYLIA